MSKSKRFSKETFSIGFIFLILIYSVATAQKTPEQLSKELANPVAHLFSVPISK